MLNLKEFINPWSVDGACIVSTIAALIEMPEREVYDEYIKDDHVKNGRMEVSPDDLLGILVLAGYNHDVFWKPSARRRRDRPNMGTVSNMIAESNPKGKFLVMNLTNHVLAIVDGKIIDTQRLSSRFRYPTDIVYSITPL